MINSFFKRCLAFVALFLCFHVSLLAQCSTPVIEDVTFPVADFFCSNEKPEMTVDLGSTKATSFYVYQENMFGYPIDVYKGTSSATSSYTLQFDKTAHDYTNMQGVFPDLYIVASDGECKSEPKLIKLPYQHVLTNATYGPAGFAMEEGSFLHVVLS